MITEFVMPGGTFSGRRYGVLTPEEYERFDVKHQHVDLEGPVSIAIINQKRRVKLPEMAELYNIFVKFNEIQKKLRRAADSLTFVTFGNVIMKPIADALMEQILDYFVVITDNAVGLRVPDLPQTEVLIRVYDVQSLKLLGDIPERTYVNYGVLVPPQKVHWMLGALKQLGMPKIGVFVDLAVLSPGMAGASV